MVAQTQKLIIMEHQILLISQWARLGEKILFNLSMGYYDSKHSINLIETVFRIIRHYNTKYAEEYYLKYKHDLDDCMCSEGIFNT